MSIMDSARRFWFRRTSMACVQRPRAKTGANYKKEEGMSTVRVLVGTRKGAFVLTADAKRARWEVSGPYFGG
jgi:hypothetical protein